MASSNMAGRLMQDYSHLRTIPALLSIGFAVASLYQFGGISEVHLTWIDYTLTNTAAMVVGLAAFTVAFASSETKQFQNYETWEMVVIAAAPILMIGTHYVTEINDLVMSNGDSVSALAFLVTVAAWTVAIR